MYLFQKGSRLNHLPQQHRPSLPRHVILRREASEDDKCVRDEFVEYVLERVRLGVFS